MNILLVIDSLGSGGAQNQLTLLAKELVKRGHRVSIFTYYKNEFFKTQLQTVDIKFVHIPKKSKLGLNVIIALTRLLRQHTFQALISFLDTPNFYSVCAARLAHSDTPVCISYRSKTDFSSLSKIDLFIKERVNAHADQIICNSVHERRRWANKYPKISSKIHTIYNGVDQARFANTEKEKANFLVVGKVRPLKNAHLLIEAVKILRDERQINIEIHWYGGKKFNKPEFQIYSDQAEQKVVKYGLEKTFYWHEPVNHLEKVYNQFSALIHPSLWEGLPNAICESLSCGLPVLASNILDHPILVEDGVRGFLFDPSDSHQIASAIIKFLSLSELEKKQMSVNCMAYAERELSLTNMVKRFEDIII